MIFWWVVVISGKLAQRNENWNWKLITVWWFRKWKKNEISSVEWLRNHKHNLHENLAKNEEQLQCQLPRIICCRSATSVSLLRLLPPSNAHTTFAEKKPISLFCVCCLSQLELLNVVWTCQQKKFACFLGSIAQLHITLLTRLRQISAPPWLITH